MVDTAPSDESSSLLRRENIGVVLGPTVFVGLLGFDPFSLPAAPNAVLASTLWMAIWWMTEAVPIPVTSLLPIVLFPLTNVGTVADATTPYADPIIFLLLGGFLLALAIERWDLHRRIAITIIGLVGVKPDRLLLGFMVATAGLSMWISNTATAMMMVPIALAVIAHFVSFQDQPAPGGLTSGEMLPRSQFGIALMLGIAYSASIGGAATLIGSPPNAVFAGVASASLDIDIGFFDWMVFALPASVVFLFITWRLLLVLNPPESVRGTDIADVISAERDALGDITTAEKRVLVIFALVAGGWILRPFVLEPLLPAVTDSVIAIIGGILLFLVPVNLRKREFLLDWDDVPNLPWGVLILLGAGFSIANAFQDSGLDSIIAESLAIVAVFEIFVLFVIIGLVIVFLTELNSNTATATVFMPIMLGLGVTIGIDPLGLMALTALVASFAFMLPVATPPNAIVFGGDYLSIPDMVRVGIWLNFIGVLLAATLTYLWFPFILG